MLSIIWMKRRGNSGSNSSKKSKRSNTYTAPNVNTLANRFRRLEIAPHSALHIGVLPNNVIQEINRHAESGGKLRNILRSAQVQRGMKGQAKSSSGKFHNNKYKVVVTRNNVTSDGLKKWFGQLGWKFPN